MLALALGVIVGAWGPRPWRHKFGPPLRRRIQTRRCPIGHGKALTCQVRGKVSRAGQRVPAATCSGGVTPFQTKNCMEWTNRERGLGVHVGNPAGRASAAVQGPALGQDDRARTSDEQVRPGHDLPPARIPRQGPPARIFQTENDITMLYRGAGETARRVRGSSAMIPLDGEAPMSPKRAALWGDRRIHGGVRPSAA